MKKILLFLGLMMVLCVGSVYAFNYAEKIEYKNNTYFIKDAYNKEIFNLRLVKNTKECLVNCEAEIKINSKDNYKTEQILKLLKINKDLKKFKKFNIEIKENAIKIKAKKKLKIIVLNTSKRGEQRIKILNNFDWKLSLLDKELHKWAWWNSSWNYRQPINISNTAGDLTNFQVRLDLNSSNVGSSFDWSSNGSDIRFTNSTDDELNFWIENWNSTGQEATIWVNVSYLANNTNTTIYMYYGNSEATSKSNGTETFIFFDDFESGDFSKWDIHEAQWSITSSTVKEDNYSAYGQGTTSSDRRLAKNISINYDVVLESWSRPATTITDGIYYFTPKTNGGTTAYCLVYYEGHFKYYQGSYTNFPNDKTYSANTWYFIQVVLDFTNSKQHTYIDGDDLGDIDLKDGSGNFYTGISQIKHAPGYPDNEDLWMDTIRIRKYADPEPTISFGGEESPINLQITSTEPENKTILYEPNINFKVNVTWDNANQTNCSLYLNGVKNNTKTDCIKGINTIEPINYNYTIYNWFIKCKAVYNEFQQEKQSSTKIVAIAEAKGEGAKYYNPFNQTTKSRRLILYPIRSFVYS